MSNPYAPPPPGHTAPPRRDPAPGSGEDAPGTPQDAPSSGPGPSGRPAGTPPRPPVDPEAARAATRPVMHFALMMLAALATGSLPLPWQVASAAFALGAVVLGARALVSVRRLGMRGGIVVALAGGIGFSAAMAVSLVALLALWPAQMERQDCLRDALTISAQERCEAAFEKAVTDRFRPATG